jgi:hypothetical protein
MNSSIYQAIAIAHATGMHSDSVATNPFLGVPLIRVCVLTSIPVLGDPLPFALYL